MIYFERKIKMRIIDFLLLKKSTIIVTFVLDFFIGLSLLAVYFESKVIEFFSVFNISPDLIHTICNNAGSICVGGIPIILGWIVYRIHQAKTGSSHTIFIGGVLGLIWFFVSLCFRIFLFWIIGAVCLILFLPLSIFTIIYNKNHQYQEEL